MKKFFTSLALFCATFLTIHAQDCVFQYEGKPLEDGATVTIKAAPDIFETLVCNTNPSDNVANGLFIVNKTSNKLSGSAKITISNKTMETDAILWCMGGACEQVTTSTKTKDFSINANDKTAVQYDCEVKREGDMLTKLEATVNGKTYTVNILFTTAESHVTATKTAASTPVAFFTLDGREVSQRPRGLCLVKFADGKVRKVVGK
ncbi:MAG: hypothetical protein IKO85_10200 [Bacteroidaceae bacterium]|nr:hypothetical protein [Bacteroidaceae bacterium]